MRILGATTLTLAAIPLQNRPWRETEPFLMDGAEVLGIPQAVTLVLCELLQTGLQTERHFLVPALWIVVRSSPGRMGPACFAGIKMHTNHCIWWYVCFSSFRWTGWPLTPTGRHALCSFFHRAVPLFPSAMTFHSHDITQGTLWQ